MKNIFARRIFFSIFITLLATISFQERVKAQAPAAAAPTRIPITGSNGRVAAFLGIKTASAKGITVQMVPDGPIIGITWDKLDLKKLEEQHPGIYEAYLIAVNEGKPTDLNLGSFVDPNAPKKPMMSTVQANGFYETTIGEARFVLQMPKGTPKGILFIAMGDDGDSHNMVPRGIPEVGVFGHFQKRHQYAIMSYGLKVPANQGPGKVSDFVLPEKRSGESVLKAIDAFAKNSKRSNLSTAPIVMYGAGRIGAAFVYNFTQWKPERIIATVASSGAFYSQKPTESSVKVPLLFLRGEYYDGPERWQATQRREEIFKEFSSLNPNWAYAIEFRAPDYESALHSYFGLEFLSQMIKKRLPEKAGEEFNDLSKSRSWVGDTETYEISSRNDPEAPLSENQTWLPSKEFAEMWQALAKGTLELPDPDRL